MAARNAKGRRLEGPGSEERLTRLRRSFQAASHSRSASRGAGSRLRDLGRSLLVIYWLGCLAIIVVGVNRIYPDLWPQVQRALPGPKVDQPFANCSAAHAAGIYNIPFWSPAYTPEQDGDGDGKACEPFRGYRHF